MLDSVSNSITAKRKFLGVFVNREVAEKLILFSIVRRLKKSDVLRDLIEGWARSVDKKKLMLDIALFLKKKKEAESLVDESFSQTDFKKHWERILIAKGLSADTIEGIFQLIEQ